MSIVSLDSAYLSFSDLPVLDHADFSIEDRERVCIVGRNGVGKSTLLKIFNGEIRIDDGTLIFQQNLKVRRLEQDPPSFGRDQTILSYLVENYRKEHGEDQHEYNYEAENRIKVLLNKMDLDPERHLQGLSGGLLRRVALADALVSEPDLLLLDEPTNHLDINAILWLQNFIKSYQGSVIFISHDREFIDSVATRIVELDRGRIYSYPGNYQQYVKNRDYQLELEQKRNQAFDRKLSQEEVWIRQGIKARRTRNEGRVRDLIKMREERRNRRSRKGNVSMQLSEGMRSGNIVFAGENVSFRYGERTIIDNFSYQVMRGDKIALIGMNGCGKSTLLKIILGQLEPAGGSMVKSGSNVEIAYFDQYREQLDGEKTVIDNLTNGKTEVEVNGHKKHVIGYLQDFLFEPRRAMVPVKALSGGEKNRLLLAKLFLKKFNVLVLDEPTNDLDIETLELLEELLTGYSGTLLLVSHDRAFVNNIVTEIWYFRGNGGIEQILGGYDELNKYMLKEQQTEQKMKESSAPEVKKVVKAVKEKTKLSYNEQKELTSLPQQIEQLEAQIEEMQQVVLEPSFYSQSEDRIKETLKKLDMLSGELQTKYDRWTELEDLQNKLRGKN